MAKKITAVIGKDGKPVFDYSGFSGDDCHKENEKLWINLGKLGLKGTAVEVESKPTEDQANPEKQLEVN